MRGSNELIGNGSPCVHLCLAAGSGEEGESGVTGVLREQGQDHSGQRRCVCGVPTDNKGDWWPPRTGPSGMERREVGQTAKQLGWPEQRFLQVRGGTPEGAGRRGSLGLGCEGPGHWSLPGITGSLTCTSPWRGTGRKSCGRSTAVAVPWIDCRCDLGRGGCR